MFDTVLVANRGEIAVRVLRTLRTLGVRSVAVYSDVDAQAPHVRAADTAVRLGPAPPAESYLHVGRLLEAAAATGAQAVHPGYGFLSESAAFARACSQAGVVFVGPPAQAIEVMGDKVAAKTTVEAAGVPVVPGAALDGLSRGEVAAAAGGVGYPLLVKAAAGGGGKGMRIVAAPEALPDALAAAGREAVAAFGDGTLLLERLVAPARHVEIQVLADAHGGVVHLGERECSLQRRHQKVIEEAPSPLLAPASRERMGAAAVAAARACGYEGAGTVEFLVAADDPDQFFFLEMNTRLQVEHPVTEEVYGLDLVAWQVRVAAGERLDLAPDRLGPHGHAVEARVYAEDPSRGFLPTGGRIALLDTDTGARVDIGVEQGSVVTSHYDPLLAKVVAHGADRPAALRRLRAALRRLRLLGVTTNVAFLDALLGDPDVQAGRLDTGLVERRLDALVDDRVPEEVYAAAGLARLLASEPGAGVVDPFDVPGGWRVGEHAWTTLRLGESGGEPVDVAVRGRAGAAQVRVGDGEARSAVVAGDAADGRLTVTLDGVTHHWAHAHTADVAWLGRGARSWALHEQEPLEAARRAQPVAGAGPLAAPMPGTVTVVHVAAGQRVTAGQTLLVVEAMKMEHPVTTPVDGTVARLEVAPGQPVAMGQSLAVVEPVAGE